MENNVEIPLKNKKKKKKTTVWPSNPTPGTWENQYSKDTWTRMFIAALYTIARTCEQPICPSKDEWTKKLQYIYTMEYYSAIKKEQIWVSWTEVKELESVIHSEISQKQKNTVYYTYIWNL